MDTAMAVRLADTFLAAYRHDDAAGRFTADGASLAIPNELMMAFEGLLPDLDPTTQCLGVCIAYGLSEDARPVFLFGPVAMTRQPSEAGILSFTLAEPLGYYTPVGGRWQKVDAGIVGAAMKRYASRMMKYVQGRLVPLHVDPSMGEASDPSSTFFPFTEFRALIEENEKILQDAFGSSNDIPSITAINLRWAAETAGNGTLKHVIVMVPVLDGPSYPRPDLPLTLKAADLNTFCPPRCDVASYEARQSTR